MVTIIGATEPQTLTIPPKQVALPTRVAPNVDAAHRDNPQPVDKVFHKTLWTVGLWKTGLWKTCLWKTCLWKTSLSMQVQCRCLSQEPRRRRAAPGA